MWILWSIAALSPSGWASELRWRPAGPGPSPVAAVAIRADRPEVWAVADDGGAVWLTSDRGARWEGVLSSVGLGAPSVDESLAGALEASVARSVEGSEAEPPGGDEALYELDPEELELYEAELAEAADDAAAALRGALTRLQGEVEATGQAVDGSHDGVVRLAFAGDGSLVVGRADGLWIAEGSGRRWRHVLDRPVTAIAEHDGGHVVGTTDGVYRSDALGRWSSLGLVGEIRALVAEDGLYAGTATGLWHTEDLIRWSRVGGPRDVAAVLALPERSGAPLAVAGAIAPWGLVGGLARSEEGEILAGAGGSVLTSADLGAHWLSVGALPAGEEIRDIAVGGGEILLATTMGLVRRVDEEPAGRGALPPGPDPDAVLAAIRASALLSPSVRWRAGTRWIPEVGIDLSAHRRQQGAPLGPLDPAETWWEAAVWLTWRPARAGVSEGDLPVVVVIGDEVLAGESGSSALLAARLSRSAAAHRAALAEVALDLLRTRRSLALAASGAGTLLERTCRRLEIDEIDARLESMTEGGLLAGDPTRARRR